MFTRLWVDTLKNLVGVVESSAAGYLARRRRRLRLNGKGNVFWLGHTPSLFVDAGFADLRSGVDNARWRRLTEFWATSHVFTHNDGLVDARYPDEGPDQHHPHRSTPHLLRAGVPAGLAGH